MGISLGVVGLGAFGAAFVELFAAHPLATQSVVYVVQRMTSLSALFYVSGLCVWIAASRSSGGRRWFLRHHPIHSLARRGSMPPETATE